VAIAGSNVEFPNKLVRARVGERTQVPSRKDPSEKVWSTKRRDHFDLAKLVSPPRMGDRRGSKSHTEGETYRTNRALMELLLREHVDAGCREECCIAGTPEPADFQPRWIPVMMLGGDPSMYWQSAQVLRFGQPWSCRCDSFEPLTDEDILEIEHVADWLRTYGMDPELALTMSPHKRQQKPLLVKGIATRRHFTQEQRGKYSVKVTDATGPHECLPARCNFFWPRDGRKESCEEEGTLTFILPFLSGANAWGVFRTRGAHSVKQITATLATAAALSGGDLTGIPLRLAMSFEPVALPDGSQQNQPIARIDFDMPALEMPALAASSETKARRDALMEQYMTADMMPALSPGTVPVEEDEAMSEEWVNPTGATERDWQSVAYEEGLKSGCADVKVTEWMLEAEQQKAVEPLEFVRQHIRDFLADKGPQDREQAETETEEVTGDD